MHFRYSYHNGPVNRPFLSTLVFSSALFLLCLGMAFLPLCAIGAEQPEGEPDTAAPQLTQAALQQRIDEINKAANLSAEAKQKIISFYEKAIESLNRREKAMSQAGEYTEALKSGPKPGTIAVQVIPPVRATAIEQRAKAMALTEIESEIALFQSQLAQEQTALELAKGKLNDAVKRPAALRKTILAYGEELARLEETLAHPKPTDKPARVIRAKRTSLRAKKEALKAELAAAEREADLFKRQVLIAQNQQAVISRKVNRLNALIKTWEEVREERQTDVGFVELRQAKAALTQMDKQTWPKEGNFLRESAKKNLSMSEALVELGEKETQASKTAKLFKTRLTQIKRDFDLTKRRIALLGLSRKSGQLLQSQRGTLLSSRADSQVAQKRRNEILDTSLASDDLLQERQNFLVLKNKTYGQLDSLETGLTKEQNDMLTTQTFLLLESYRKLLEETGKIYIKYLKSLNSQEAGQREIDALSKEYRNYINQRLFWTLSSEVFLPGDISRSGEALAWLAKPANWRLIAKDFKMSVSQRPSIWGLLFLALLAPILLRSWFNSRTRAIDECVGKTGEASIRNTLALMLLILLKTAWIPVVIYLSAQHLWYLPTAHNFTRAFCSGILSSAETIILVGIIVQLCRAQGIGRVHFGWSETACDLVERSAKTILFVFVPIFFFVVMIQNGPQDLGYRSALGRLLFVLSMIPIVFVLVRVLKVSNPLIEAIGKNRPEGWLNKYRRVWSSVIIAVPIVFIILTALGYYLTAYELGRNFGKTLWLMIILVTADALMRRGLRLAQIEIAIKKAEAEREAAKRRASEIKVSDEDNVEPVAVVSKPTLEVEEIDEKTSLLIRTAILISGLLGLFMIWGDIFPAFRFLDNVELWQHQSGVDKDGKAVLAPPTTLLNLIVALVIFAGTIVAVRSSTALLEIVALRRTKLDPGTRHAFGLICRYTITAVGLFLGLSAFGIVWKQFQWLAAAMTLGLSFGLQDIFANFVSGIIILFERPVRVGDVVTVSGSSGRVTRIRIRSTTITDWDRRELIVPNKAFLSEKIINWSLSDNMSRVVIDIGIGYGSDAAKAEELLLKIAKANKFVKKDPGPSVVFTGFGADSLDFKLRAFVAMSDRVKVANKIRHEIFKMFNEAGIEIPFAQRDTHLDTSAGPLEIRMIKGKEKDN